MKRKPNVDINKLNINDSYIEVDGLGMRKPTQISIKDAKKLMDIHDSNIKLVIFEDQDSSITRPPDTYPIGTSMHLAVDENFLYVWAKNRWKRMPLSNF